MKAALYTRVSTSEQATEGNSLDAQLAALRTYAKLRNLEIYEEYTDGGFSGGTDNRPALQRLMQDALEKRFDILIVAKLDRFFRNLKHLVNYISQMDSLGIGFVSTQESLDTSNPMGKFTLNILGVIAEFERGRIGERIKDARRISVSKNQWSSGRTPFGYRFDKETKELVIEPLEAEVIQFMFNHYLNDSLGIIRLAELLNSEKKITPRLGHRKHNLWTQSAVRYVLTHPAYKGGLTKTWDYKCPAIIDLTTWDNVQKRLKTNRHFKPTAEHREFQGLLKCGICGHVLRIGYNHNTNPHYECPGRLKREHLDGSDRCTLPRQQADALDKSLNTQVSEIFNNPELFNEHVNKTVRNLESEVKELERRLKPLQAETDRIIKDMDVIEAKFEVGRVDRDAYTVTLKELQSKLRTLEKRQAEADPMLIKEYRQKLEVLESCKEWGEAISNKPNKDMPPKGYINAIRKSTQGNYNRIGDFRGVDLLGTPFKSPREAMQKWGMVGYVYPDKIEIKGSLQIGKSVVSPDYRSGRCPQSR